MSRQTLPQIQFMIEFMIKLDPSKVCRIRKNVGRNFFLELKETMKQFFLWHRYRRDILNLTTAVGNELTFYRQHRFEVCGLFLST